MPVYACVDPASTDIMPKCLFYHLTGYECPACGIQRAMHAFLNGNFKEAIAYNYFLIVSIPYFFAVAITTFCKGKIIEFVRFYVQHPNTVKSVITLTLLWWIIRNMI